MKGKLTKAQRRVLAGWYRSEQESQQSNGSNLWWDFYVPQYGRRGWTYFAIAAKLQRRGYLTKQHVAIELPCGGFYFAAQTTDKGRKALQYR